MVMQSDPISTPSTLKLRTPKPMTTSERESSATLPSPVGTNVATTIKPGYHLANIQKGEFGELSKIREELEELEDANRQGCRVMELVELSDLVGAVGEYAKKFGFSLDDLLTMSEITRRAWNAGDRG